jgi:hypothetical protein
VDEIECAAIRDEGYDPDDPAVIAALHRVRAELAAFGRVCREQDGILRSIGPVDELLDERIAAGHLAHRSGTDQYPAVRG